MGKSDEKEISRPSITVAQSFNEYYLKQSLPSIRFSFVLAILLYAAFSILDIYAAPHSKDTIYFVRFGVVIPVIGVIMILSYWSYFARYSQVFLCIVSLTVSFGIIYIILSTKPDEPAYKIYYSGLILSMIWTHTVLRLRSEISITTSLVVISSYNISVFVLSPIPLYSDFFVHVISNNFFLLGAFIVATWAGYATERMFRENYEQSVTIQRERDALNDSKGKLEELNATKSKLISIMAHDLRSPIAGIKGLLTIYQSGYVTDIEFQENTKKLSVAVENTLSLLENLLSWSVVQIHNYNVEKKPVSLHEMVANVFNLLDADASRKNITLENNVCEKIKVLAEPTLTELVIRNLVANSIKFTEQGTITVKATALNGFTEVMVKDTGRGMAPEIAANLFSWSNKRSTTGTRSEKGAGIGLLICKEFIERQGGKMYFDTKFNMGTSFHFTVPAFVSPVHN
jgi:signal transduction histidine kinase